MKEILYLKILLKSEGLYPYPKNEGVCSAFVSTLSIMPYLYTSNYKEFEIRNNTKSSEILVSFVGAKYANHCLPGDEVAWNGSMCQLVQRAPHQHLVGTLELRSKYLYGHTSRGHKVYQFHPFHSGYPPMRVGTSERDVTNNKLILVQFQDWDAHESLPRANCIRVFGICGSLAAETMALQWHYGYPQHNKAYVEIGYDSIHLRNLDRIMLHGTTINIDPAGCRDIDDVITFRQMGLNEWEIVITIADVAEYIEEMSLADTLAQKKGQTLYQDGTAVIPMLPPHLSEDTLSLLPGKDRLGVSLFCDWNHVTKQLKPRYFDLTHIVNTMAYTYTTIYQATNVPLDVLQAVASTLKGTETTDSHEWVEELMLLYNKEAAKLLLERKAGLLRTHTPANQEKLTIYEAIHPDLRFLAFTSAKYAPTADGLYHAGLGSVPYAHASSPLRRYADLVNQRALKSILREGTVESSTEILASHLNEQQKKQKQYDRDMFLVTQMSQSNIGKKTAIVLASDEMRTKVYVPAWKRILHLKQSPLPKELKPKEEVLLEYYADLQKPRWENRMVFHLTLRAPSPTT